MLAVEEVERCICRRTPFQESNQLNTNGVAAQASQVSLKSEGSWRCSTYFDCSFAAPDFPPTSLRSGSWDELFSNKSLLPSGHNFIKEIYVNDRHLVKPDTLVNEDPPKPHEPRQKFQRFRQKKFVCDECDRWFTMKQNVQQHFFQYHNPNGARKKAVRIIAKRFQCTKCNKIFKTLEKAQRHEARMHGESFSPSVFVCQLCNKVYNAHSQLKEHVDVVHENRRPYKCEHCGMDFGRVGGLRRHDMMVHQQKLHACPYKGCEHPGYKCTKALAAHIRSVHTMDRPFKCLFCDRSFVRKNDLKVHETTHSSHSEYVCKKCKCSFRRPVYLQKHEKRCNSKERRRKLLKQKLRKDGSLVSSEQGSGAPFECTTDTASYSVDEYENVIEEKSIDADETVEKLLELYDEEDLSMEVTTNEAVMKEGNPYEVRETRDFEEEDLEDGELSESSSVECRKSHTRKKLHHSKRHHLHHSHHSRKKHKKTLLKLPRKSIARGDKEKFERIVEGESENRYKVKTEQIIVPKSENKVGVGLNISQKDDLGRNTCYAQVPDKLTSTVGPLEEVEELLNLAKRETLIKQETEEVREVPSRHIQVEEEKVKKEECANRRIRFEPREEAFIPKKRSLLVNSFSLLHKKRKLDIRDQCKGIK